MAGNNGRAQDLVGSFFYLNFDESFFFAVSYSATRALDLTTAICRI